MEDTARNRSGEGTWQALDPEEVFARHLRALRQKAGLTQQQVVDQMRLRGFQMHRSAIAKIEASTQASQRPVRVNEAVALADILGVPVSDLVVDPNAQRRHAANVKRQQAEERLQSARVVHRAVRFEVEARRAAVAEAAALLANAERQLETTAADLAAVERWYEKTREAEAWDDH